VLAIWLLFLRPHFHARSDPPSIWQGLRALVAALLFTVAYGVIGFYLLDRHFSVRFGFLAALQQTIIMFTQFYDPGLQPITRFGQYFAGSIYLVSSLTFTYAMLMLFRPVLVRHPASAVEQSRAISIVEAYGRTALARFTLFDDKSYYFSPGGSMLAYAVRGRVALALGDPIGPTNDAATAIAGFQRYCAQNDWEPVFYQAQPDYLEHYRAAGLETVCIGHEAIVDLAGFSLRGGANKALRVPVTKLTKLGYRAALYEPPLPDSVLHELRAVSDEWLTMRKGREMRFSLGAFEDDYIRGSRVMAVHTPEGPISAFANIVSEYRHNGISIDLMRRRPQVENGTMEFLFVNIIEWARTCGYATFNLGLSALAGVGEDADDPAVEKALHYIYEHIYHFYNFKGLHVFKNKFNPQWSPRYLVYPGSASLPAVAIALIRADSGNSLAWDNLASFLRDSVYRHARPKTNQVEKPALKPREEGVNPK
jgi:phosphatidylglycerol lysyltransferase